MAGEQEQQISLSSLYNGPIPHYKRQTNDIGCFLFYGVSFLLAVGAVTTACLAGNFGKLSRSLGQGYRCGQPGQRSQDYPYAYFFNLTSPTIHYNQTICVSKCPTANDIENKAQIDCFNNFDCPFGKIIYGNQTDFPTFTANDHLFYVYPSETVLDRVCLPSENVTNVLKQNNKNISNIFQDSLYQPTFNNLWIDLLNFYPYLLICCGVIVLISFLMRLVLRLVMKPCILWTGFAFSLLGFAILGCMLLLSGGYLRSERKYFTFIVEEKRQIYLITGILCFILFGFQLILTIYRLCIKNKLQNFQISILQDSNVENRVAPINSKGQLASQDSLLQEESTIFDGTFSISLIFTLFLLVVWTGTLIVSLYLASGVQYRYGNNFPVFENDTTLLPTIFEEPKTLSEEHHPPENPQIIILNYAMLGWGFWTQLIIVSFAKVLIAYKISLKFFEKKTLSVENEGALRIVLRYHFGSIIMSAFFCLFLGPFYYLFWTFCEKENQQEETELNCFTRFWNKFQSYMSCMNESSHPLIAISGLSFIQSSSMSYDLLWKKNRSLLQQVRVRKITANCWRWAIIALVCGIMCFVFSETVYMQEPFYFVVIIFIIGMGIMQLWTMSYELKAQVDTIAKCLKGVEEKQKINKDRIGY